MSSPQRLLLLKKFFVRPTTRISDTMRVIDRSGEGVAFVVDSRRKLLGSVTDGDIRRAILKGVAPDEPIDQVMNNDPLFVHAHWDSTETIRYTRSRKVRSRGPFISFRLPCVDLNNEIIDIFFVHGSKIESTIDKRIQKKERPRSVQRVLVIGGAGLIGSVLVRQLLLTGYEVVVLDSFIYGDAPLRDIENRKRLTIIKGDTRHLDVVARAMRDVQAVVHLAELVGDPACALNPSETLQTNYLATQQVALMCKYFHINRLIYTSSCSVYGASESEELLKETSAVHPTSLYARMKLESERALFELTDDNFAPTILRLATVYGKSYRPRFDLVVNLLTAKAVREKTIPIFGGSQWRPNVHVADVGHAVLQLIESPLHSIGGEVFNVGSTDQNYTIQKLGEIINEIIPRAEIVIKEDQADIRNYKVDFSKLQKRGFSASKNVHDGVREIRTLLQTKKLDHTDKHFSNIQFLKALQT